MRIYDTSYLVDGITRGKDLRGAILDLTLYEIANVVKKAVERGEITEKEGEILLKYLTTLDLNVIRIQTDDLQKILSIAKRYGLTAYDAAYVYFAVKNKAELMTLDRKMNNAYTEVKKKGYL